jgi:hypothetical protein
MVRVFASLRVPIKSFLENSIMDSCKGKGSCTSQLEITIWENLGSIRKKEEVYITGQGNRAMFIKDSSKRVNAMAEELFGGATEAGMKVNLGMECKVDGVPYTERVETVNMKVIGIMECLTGRELNTSRTGKDIKEHSNKINSMAKVYFTKTTQ